MDEIREESWWMTLAGSIFYAIVFLIAYMCVIFENLPGMDYWASLRVFAWTCIPAIVLSIVLNVFNTDFSRKVFNVTLPLGVYTVVTYFRDAKMWFTLLGIVTVAVIAFYGTLIFSQKIKRRERAHIIRRRRLHKFFKGSELILNYVLTAIVVGIYIKIIVVGFWITSPTESVGSFEEAKAYTIESRAEDLRPIACGGWEELSISEKLGVLQIVANIETGRLGCDTSLRVGAGSRSDEVQGCYSGQRNSITINRDYLDEGSAGEVLKTVLHECRHAYQEMLVEAYNDADEKHKNLCTFADAKEFKAGFENYTDENYYSNPVEADARIYSELMAKEYFVEIRRELGEG